MLLVQALQLGHLGLVRRHHTHRPQSGKQLCTPLPVPLLTGADVVLFHMLISLSHLKRRQLALATVVNKFIPLAGEELSQHELHGRHLFVTAATQAACQA
ncbi:hypothetical protein [Acidovorax sp. Leaf73]|uniref:hypothetical protein n=1 Tax=Acidovorax sp. Leaf73 TaxID=2876566 RepID=UPI001E2D6CAE|nr:hypothetical protein [Acidovorax sp. Leaf73]